MGPRCTLITVTFNSAHALEEFWTGFDSNAGIEWIVVDNQSSDDTVEVAERLGANVIRLDRNRGFSYANNVGLARASADFIGFVNPDLRLDAEGIERLRLVAEAEGALVAPQLSFPDGSLQPNGRGYPFLTAKIRNRLRGDDLRYLLFAVGDAPRPVCWAMGAALFATREVLGRLGGWDPRFFLYYEDKDICLRAWRQGTPVLVVPAGRFVHGWARDTTTWRWAPWRRELASMAKFYMRYPEFLLGGRASRHAHPRIEERVFPAASTR